MEVLVMVGIVEVEVEVLGKLIFNYDKIKMIRVIYFILKIIAIFVVFIIILFYFYKNRIVKNANENLQKVETTIFKFNKTRCLFYKKGDVPILKLDILKNKDSLKAFKIKEYESILLIENFKNDTNYLSLQKDADKLNHVIRNYNFIYMSYPNVSILKSSGFKRLNQYFFRYSLNPQDPQKKSNWDLWVETGNKDYYQKALENDEI